MTDLVMCHNPYCKKWFEPTRRNQVCCCTACSRVYKGIKRTMNCRAERWQDILEAAVPEKFKIDRRERDNLDRKLAEVKADGETYADRQKRDTIAKYARVDITKRGTNNA